VAEDTVSIPVRGLAQPTRLDRVLRTVYPQAGRQAVQRLIGAGQVAVNGQTVRLSSWLVRNGDRLALLAEPPDKPAQLDALTTHGSSRWRMI